jgi:16S rRNA processing protein RimM
MLWFFRAEILHEKVVFGGIKMEKEFLEIGKIVNTHGIKGELKVMAWCDSPEIVLDFDELYIDEGTVKLEIENSKVHKNMVILKISGYNNINEVLYLKNKVLYVPKDEFKLEENCYFIKDLIGMTVIDADDETKVYGKLYDITQAGGNDVYYIKNQKGKDYLIPAIADVVINTDIEKKVMTIRPLKGLFDDED